MTKPQSDTNIIILTFRKGQDNPEVKMNSHLYLDFHKIEAANQEIRTKFLQLANAASAKAQAARRAKLAEEKKHQVNPEQQRLQEAKAILEETVNSIS